MGTRFWPRIATCKVTGTTCTSGNAIRHPNVQFADLPQAPSIEPGKTKLYTTKNAMTVDDCGCCPSGRGDLGLLPAQSVADEVLFPKRRMPKITFVSLFICMGWVPPCQKGERIDLLSFLVLGGANILEIYKYIIFFLIRVINHVYFIPVHDDKLIWCQALVRCAPDCGKSKSAILCWSANCFGVEGVLDERLLGVDPSHLGYLFRRDDLGFVCDGWGIPKYHGRMSRYGWESSNPQDS